MTHPSPTRRSSDLSCVSIRECTRELGRHHFFSQCHQMQRADQWLTGDFLDDVAVYPEPERFGHLIILELIGQHDQMRIRKPLLQFAAIVCSEMVRPIVYDDDVTALLFRTSHWSVLLARILEGGGYSEVFVG